MPLHSGQSKGSPENSVNFHLGNERLEVVLPLLPLAKFSDLILSLTLLLFGVLCPSPWGVSKHSMSLQSLSPQPSGLLLILLSQLFAVPDDR